LTINQLAVDLLIVLFAGFLSGGVCKRVGASMLVGYLIVGALIGEGGLGLVSQEQHELEYLARAGALFLLFSVGIEFSLQELHRLSQYFFVGGSVQMLLVAAPLALACFLLGAPWRLALLVGAAGALSSTILVFKTLAEWGQTATPHGRRAIGMLLFQDAAIVPLILLVPLLTGAGDQSLFASFGWLIVKSGAFLVAVVLLHYAVARWIVPMLANLRSVELVVLFTLTILGAACHGAFAIGLPPALGALAAGVTLSGNRLSEQIDTLVLPFRETFAAVFFVTLGTLLHPLRFLDEPLLLTAGIVGVLTLKSMAAAAALKLVGLNWKAALGMGIGLAQLGEFSFLLIAVGVGQGLISPEDYNRLLFIALGTLIITPQLIQFGLRWTGKDAGEEREKESLRAESPVQQALVIGIGPIGRGIASRLETLGVDVCLIDFSPINLHPFAQQGFHSVVGDARDPQTLARVDVARCRLAVVCIPDDEAANQTTRTLREMNPTMFVLVRCRFLANVDPLRKAGADSVVSEEQQASGALLKLCEQVVRQSGKDPVSPALDEPTVGDERVRRDVPGHGSRRV
ncbi:MAG: cation:proton antiporter, partial [Planctomycetales bacterium]